MSQSIANWQEIHSVKYRHILPFHTTRVAAQILAHKKEQVARCKKIRAREEREKSMVSALRAVLAHLNKLSSSTCYFKKL